MLTRKKTDTLVGVTIDNKENEVRTKVYFMGPEEMSKIIPPSKKPKTVFSKGFLYDSDEESVDKRGVTEFKELIARTGQHCEPFYRPSERLTIFIAGAQNCGKSYWVANFLDEYKYIHPNRPIYLVTGLNEPDKHFERHKIRRIDMDVEVIDDIDLEKLREDDVTGKRTGCLIIFDDTDRIRDKQLMKRVYDLLHDALCNGRDHATQSGAADIDVIITNHEINDYQRTRYILTECNYLVLFPQCSLKKQLDMCIEKVGMSKEAKDYILSYTDSRSLVIHKTYPFYCITINKIFLIK